MINPVEIPTRGGRMRAGWAADVAAAINTLASGGRVGMLMRNGLPSPVPGNGRMAAVIDSMPFALSYGSVEVEGDGEGSENETAVEETHLYLTNCRYLHAGEYHLMDDVDIHDMRGLIALKVYVDINDSSHTIGSAEVVAFDDDDIEDAFLAANFYAPAYKLIPLYFVDEDGEITHDLRALPVCAESRVPWAWNGTSFNNAYVQIGRSITEVSTGNANITAAGSYYVHAIHPLGSSPSAELVRTAGANDDDNTYLHVATLATSSSGDVRQSFGIYAYPIVYLYD